MADTLPRFRYHPDPIATGSVVASDTPCVCCERVRGYIYIGPVNAEANLDETFVLGASRTEPLPPS